MRDVNVSGNSEDYTGTLYGIFATFCKSKISSKCCFNATN